MKIWVDTLFTANDLAYTPSAHAEVIAGLFPEYREIYYSLPDSIVTTLDLAQVIEMRERHAEGESVSSIARDLGARRRTVSDVVNRKTWKDVA